MIDIITTVYNTPIKDLERCFNSIKNQTYTNWKTIIIDDGSKDEIKNWLDSWCKINEKFEVKHIDNKGVSNARNLGLKESKSEYVTFCDSDDAFSINFLDDATKIMIDFNPDLIIGSTEIVYKDRTEVKEPLNNRLYSSNEVKLVYKYMLAGCTTEETEELNTIYAGRIYPKLFKKSILKDIEFDVHLKMHEDNLFVADILEKIDSVYVSKNIWYYYFKNDYSITNVKYSEELLNQELIFAEKISEKMKILNDDKLNDSFKLRLFNTFLLYIDRLSNTKYCTNKKIINLLNNRAFDNIFDFDINNFIGISKEKIILFRLLKTKNKLISFVFVKGAIVIKKLKI